MALLGREQRRDRTRRRAEAADFVDLLLELSEDETLPVYIVLTMRTDFLGDCDLFYGLPEAMNRSRYLVPRLTRQQLRQAIEGPPLLLGVPMASRLLDRVLNELGDRSDRLPILQHALLRTWDMWMQEAKTSPIDIEEYEAAGTLDRSLSLHAEGAIVNTDLDATSKIFKCLTDTDYNHRRVRRASRLGELAAVTGVVPATLLPILQRFRDDDRNFLIFSGGDDPRIEISHESLIRQWDRLRNWVDEERASRDHFLELVNRAAGDRALLRNPDLHMALTWRAQASPSQAWAERYCGNREDFPAAMNYLSRSEAAARDEAHQHILVQLRSAASWFYWLALASMINSAVSMAGGNWAFIFSLGMTQIMDAVMSGNESGDLAGVGKSLGLIFNLLLVGIFLLFGKFARQGRRWAFVSGMSLYAIDALIILLISDYFGLLFHLWVLYKLYAGLGACRELRNVSAG